MHKVALFLVLSVFCIPSFASRKDTTIEKRHYEIQEISGTSPVIDGYLNESVWEKANWSGGFKQHRPNNGEEPSFNTDIAISYDDSYIYVGIKAFDPNPDSIVSRIARRDEVDGDIVAIGFDSYYDLRTGFIFVISAGGTRGDMLIADDGQSEDESWNAVWWGKTSINDEGWVAEIKIPFSQLRFDNTGKGVWGFNVMRNIFRYNEESFWQNFSNNDPGFIHHFGEIHGLKGVQPRKQAEITPYVTGGIEKYEPDAENPFLDGRNNILNAGFDAKLGVTNNLTLDLSVNPDFGQVEADPSEVNLTAYESFFREKRPLFVEGNNIYSFPLRWGGGHHGENLFYSRRIGRRPHYYPDLNSGEYSKQPEQTNILAAAKLTGKTRGGTSIGVLNSITGEEFATIDLEGNERKEMIEPLTNYFVGRVSQDLNEGNTILGGIVTSTYRDIKSSHLEFLPKSAISGGVDFQQFFGNKNYNVKLVSYFSQVDGTPEAISEIQQAPARTFQRPNADYLTLDTTLTRLRGHGGNIQFWKTGGRLNVLAAMVWKSPGLELNDLGFLRSSDEIFQLIWMGYNWNEPFSIFRRLSINADQYAGWDFGGNRQMIGLELGANAQFKNLWSSGMHLNYTGEKRFNGILRGGPSMKLPPDIMFLMMVETNETKRLILESWIRVEKNLESDGFDRNVGLEIEYKPSNSLSISAEPGISHTHSELQYITTISMDEQMRYLHGTIDQRMISMEFRMNYSITPDLTIQYWGQPFLAAGEYSDFKYITNSLADQFSDRFRTFNSSEISYDENELLYTINEEGTGVPEYSMDSPDFNVKEFLSNLVIRWEYQPGSSIFLVWSQNRSGFDQNGQFNLTDNFNQIWDEKPVNVFLVKFSYRLGR